MSKPIDFTNEDGGFLGFGSFQAYLAQPMQYLMDKAIQQGGVATFKFGTVADVYLVSDPDFVREILVKQWQKTVRWDRFVKASSNVTDYNIVFADGDSWRTQRKLLTPAFHVKRVQEYFDLMQRHTRAMLAEVPSGEVVDMHRVMTDLAMRIIGQILFNIENMGAEASELSHAIEVLLEQFIYETTTIIKPPRWFPTDRNRRNQAAIQTINNYLLPMIAERRASGEDHGDVLSALIMAQDAETGEQLTDHQIRDELYSLFIAGHETTSLWLSWTLYLLAQYPNIQEQLVQAILADDVTELDPKNYESIGLLDRVLKESIRMYPPAWSLFLRTTIDAIELGDKIIPENKVIYISPYVQHHLPHIWDDPYTFNPSRFDEGWKESIPAYAYIPFGGGARVCLGAYMAEIEAKIILRLFLQEFRVSLAESDQDVWADPQFTLHPFGGLPLHIERRESV